MKAGIHPLYVISKVVCVCGNAFETRSTKGLIKLEICSACHPFYTGQQKLIDTAGRVERFRKRFESTGGKTIERKHAKPALKKLEHVGAIAKRKILSTAPKTAGDQKKEKASKKASKKDA